MRYRGIAPIVGLTLILACTIGLSVSIVALSGSIDSTAAPSQVMISGTADSHTAEIALRHDGGDRLDVTSLTFIVAIDGTDLTHQPPIPFFSAVGFQAGPTGPFNSARNHPWSPGETGTLRLASTNEPQLEANSDVRVDIYLDDTRITTVAIVAE